MAWFHAQAHPAGTAASAASCASRALSRRPAHRARTRAEFVSTTPWSSSNANAATARAVYGPIPGRASSAARSDGKAAAVALDDRASAHRCSARARRL